MFVDAGKKIKKFATVLFWAAAVSFVILGLLGIVIGVTERDIVQSLLGAGYMIIGIPIMWFTCLFISGFGQLIENTEILIEIEESKEDKE